MCLQLAASSDDDRGRNAGDVVSDATRATSFPMQRCLTTPTQRREAAPQVLGHHGDTIGRNERLVNQRNEARKKRDFSHADLILPGRDLGKVAPITKSVCIL